MLRTGASRNAPVDDRQRALGKPRVGCRPVPRRTAPGGCKGERDEQGTRIEWGGGVEASMLADPHPDCHSTVDNALGEDARC